MSNGFWAEVAEVAEKAELERQRQPLRPTIPQRGPGVSVRLPLKDVPMAVRQAATMTASGTVCFRGMRAGAQAARP
jgi:hypothetical protein